MSDGNQMPGRARNNPFRQRRSFAPLPPQEARRQGAISTLAFQLLGGRDPALAFLNGECAELLGRPIAIATLSEAGYAIVEREIRSRAMDAGDRHAD
ncbi:hypothetical protein [Sphingopyxis panaciterrae]